MASGRVEVGKEWKESRPMHASVYQELEGVNTCARQRLDRPCRPDLHYFVKR